MQREMSFVWSQISFFDNFETSFENQNVDDPCMFLMKLNFLSHHDLFHDETYISFLTRSIRPENSFFANFTLIQLLLKSDFAERNDSILQYSNSLADFERFIYISQLMHLVKSKSNKKYLLLKAKEYNKLDIPISLLIDCYENTFEQSYPRSNLRSRVIAFVETATTPKLAFMANCITGVFRVADLEMHNDPHPSGL